MDLAGHRIFVAALGNNTVEVVDVEAGKVIHSIRGLHEPQGLFFSPNANQLYVANGQDGHVRVFDGQSLQQIGDYDFNNDADNIRFEPAIKEVFVGYGDGAHAPDEFYLIESKNPKVFGMHDATKSHVDLLYALARDTAGDHAGTIADGRGNISLGDVLAERTRGQYCAERSQHLESGTANAGKARSDLRRSNRAWNGLPEPVQCILC